jgi:hypothetical protein
LENHSPQEPADDEQSPHDEPSIVIEKRTRSDDRHGDHHSEEISSREYAELLVILSLHRVPEPREHAQVCSEDHSKCRAVLACRTGCEHPEQCQQPHLDEHERSCPPIATAVEIVVQRSVQPGDPDQTEHDRELDRATPRDIRCEMMRRPCNHHHVHEVVEQFEERHASVLDDVAVGAGRLPEVSTELVERRGRRAPIGHCRDDTG